MALSQNEVLKCVSYDTGSSTLSYLIACPETQQAVLIDPVLEQKDRDLALLAELGLKLKCVLNTHCHADYVTSGGSIRRDMPEVKTIISENSGAKADIHIKHGDVVNFGNLALEVRATLGHTNGCVTYVLRTKMATFAFTGDTLLIQGCGRTDFQQGSEERCFNQPLTKTVEDFEDLMANLMPGSDYNPPPPQTSPEQNKRGAPNQVREKLFGGAGPIPILRAINNLKP